jgi:hypothetical protein
MAHYPILGLHVADPISRSNVTTHEITRIGRFGESPGLVVPGYASMKHRYRIPTFVKTQSQEK